jgi:hypothetical protein
VRADPGTAAASQMHLVRDERLKLPAVAFNNVGFRTIAIEVIAPPSNGVSGGWFYFLEWFVAGTILVLIAHAIIIGDSK